MTAVKKPATKPTSQVPRQTTIRSDMIDRLWRAKHSPWKTATLAATLAAIATPIIEYAATRTVTLNAAPLLGYAVAPTIATLDPHSRKKAKTDLRNAPTSAKTRRAWKQWTNTPEGAAVTYGASFTREMLTGQKRRAPRIIRVTRDPDTVTIEAPSFLTQAQWDALAEPIGRALNRKPPTITLNTERREATLTFGTAAETTTIPAWKATVPHTMPNPRALPVARSLEGDALLPLLGTHLLVAGASGAGKGSVLWSIVRTLAPGIRDQTVELWGIDPKGGIELGFGRAMFTRFAGNGEDTNQQIVDILESAVIMMRERLDTMFTISRLHEPRVGSPFIVIIFDEFLTVSATITDPKMLKRAMAALTLLLSQGRAAGITVIAAAQLAQKNALTSGMRDLLLTRVCLRVSDAEQVDMCLGVGARKQGAEAEKIGADQQGTGYLIEDGGLPILVRFPWCSDEQVKAMARDYPAPLSTITEDTRPPTPAAKPAPPAKPAAVTSPIRAAVETELDAGATDTTKIAATAGCTTRYVRTIINERRKARTAASECDDTPTTRTNQTHPEPVQEQALEPATQPPNETELHSGSAGRRVRNEVPKGDPTSVVKSPQVDALTSVFSDPPSLVQWGSQTEETDWVDVLGDRA